MPKHVWGDSFRCQRRAADCRGGGVLGDQQPDRVAAEWPARAGREQWVVRIAAAFGEPLALGRNGFFGQWGRALFSSFPGDFDMGADTEVDIADAQADQF